MKVWHSVLASFSCLCMSAAQAVPALLLNFNQLVRAVEQGDDVKAIVHFELCQISDPALLSQIAQNIDGASTRFNFVNYLHYNVRINGQLRDTVVTSINQPFEHSAGEFWNVFGRLTVLDDNTALVHINVVDPLHHKSQFAADWLCDISNGRDENGLYLYNGF